MFSCRQLLFSKLFYCQQYCQQEKVVIGILLTLFRPSLPRFTASSCRQQNPSISRKRYIFSRNSEGTLGTFSVRFCGMFVLPCLDVLVPGGALATLLLAAAEAAAAMAVLVPGGAFGQQQQQQARFRHTIRCCFAVARGPFCKRDACSLEPPNKSCRRQKKRYFF